MSYDRLPSSCCLMCKTGSVQDLNSLKYLRDKYKLAPILVKLFNLPQDPYEDLVEKASICPGCYKKLEEVQILEKRLEAIKCDLRERTYEIEQGLFEAQEGQENFVNFLGHSADHVELTFSKDDIETRNKICSLILRNSTSFTGPRSHQEIQMEQQMIKIENFNTTTGHNNMQTQHAEQMEMNYDWGIGMSLNDQQPQQPQNNVPHFADPFLRVHQYDDGQLAPADISNSPQEFHNYPKISKTTSRNPAENFSGNFVNTVPSVSTPAACCTTNSNNSTEVVQKRGRGRPRKDGTPCRICTSAPSTAGTKRKIGPAGQKKISTFMSRPNEKN